jgi:hypothetical protein
MGRAGVLQPFALGHYGLLGARGIRLSWSALRGKRALLCWQGSLGVVAPAFIDAGKKETWSRSPSLHRRRKKETWSRSPFIDSGKKRNLVSPPKAFIDAGKNNLASSPLY